MLHGISFEPFPKKLLIPCIYKRCCKCRGILFNGAETMCPACEKKLDAKIKEIAEKRKNKS